MKFKHGLAFPDADEYLFDRLPESGVWQDDALQEGLKHCKNFRTAIDGGAHIGTWSLALAEKFARVHSFEIAIDTFEALCTNVKNRENIFLYPAAIGAAEGLGSVTCAKKNMKRKHTGARFVSDGNEFSIVKIDNWNFQDLDFIKLDLEGYESQALIGAMETLKRCKPVIVFEDKGLSVRNFNIPEDASRNLLTSLGAVEFAKCGINRVWGWA